MKRVCVVYELVPEETSIYYFEISDETVLERMKAAHGAYVNHVDLETDDAMWLYEYVDARPENKLALDQGAPITGPIDLIVHSGFLL